MTGTDPIGGNVSKAAVRAAALETRRALSPQAVAAGSRAIQERLSALAAYREAGTLLCYVASKDNEVETLPLITAALAAGRDVLVPVMQPGRRLGWSRLERVEDLTPNRWGILEPESPARVWVDPPVDAVCVVPGVAFRRDGYRVGYGGGYYDRFLSVFVGKSIGLSFSCQLSDAWTPDNFDQPVDFVVTEEAVFERTR
jgi:5-formyltetrahydrofolate cyclo-ligase